MTEAAPIDLCHYDSGKIYRGRMWAYPLPWNALRPGGLILHDDISDDIAFRDFAVALGREPVAVAAPDGDQIKCAGEIPK